MACGNAFFFPFLVGTFPAFTLREINFLSVEDSPASLGEVKTPPAPAVDCGGVCPESVSALPRYVAWDDYGAGELTDRGCHNSIPTGPPGANAGAGLVVFPVGWAHTFSTYLIGDRQYAMVRVILLLMKDMDSFRLL